MISRPRIPGVRDDTSTGLGRDTNDLLVRRGEPVVPVTIAEDMLYMT